MIPTTLNLFDTDSEGSNIGPHSCNWANNSRTLPLTFDSLALQPWLAQNLLCKLQLPWIYGSPPCFCLWSAEIIDGHHHAQLGYLCLSRVYVCFVVSVCFLRQDLMYPRMPFR